MSTRFVFIHGNDTNHWSGAWAPWLKTEIEKLGFETFFETFPDSIMARSKYWLPFLKDHVRAGGRDILIGWSSGAVAAMRYAEENKIKGSILVSPCYTDLGDELEKASGYFDNLWNWKKIRNNQEKIALAYGDNDPYVPQEQFEFIASELVPEIIKVHGAEHFLSQDTFPEIIDYIKKNYL